MKGSELRIHALMQSVLSKEVTFKAPFNRLLRDLSVHLRARYIDVDLSNQESLRSITKRVTDNEQAMGSIERYRTCSRKITPPILPTNF